VLLYQPRDAGLAMPLGLLALGSWLSEEHVVLVDGRFDLAPEARVAELAPHAVCLGVSARTGGPLRDALRVSAAARAASPRLTIVWGGPHATHAPDSCLGTRVVDACVRGAGEAAFAGIVAAARAGRSLRGIPGVVCDGGIVPRPQPPPEPACLPRAQYGLLDLERHFEARGARRLDYCSSRGAREGAFAALPAERVLGEIEELQERHRLSDVCFQEEDFFADAARVDTIAEGLAARGGRLGWQAPVRPADVIAAGVERLRRLAGSGCRKLHVRSAGSLPLGGVEARQAVEAGVLLHEAGLAARFDFGVADPGPRADALAEAIACARELCAMDGRFETPLRRAVTLPAPAEGGTLEAWAVREEAKWPSARAEGRFSRAAFFFAEAQRPPGRRPGKHVLRLLALLRVRLGIFGLDLERRAVELSAVLRTGRPRRAAGGD
jgi:hypothetical protein